MIDIVKFTYLDLEVEDCSYACSSPGDRSGEYVEVEEVDWLMKALLKRAAGGALIGPTGHWYCIGNEEAQKAAAYLSDRHVIEVRGNRFRWLNLEAGEGKQ